MQRTITKADGGLEGDGSCLARQVVDCHGVALRGVASLVIHCRPHQVTWTDGLYDSRGVEWVQSFVQADPVVGTPHEENTDPLYSITCVVKADCFEIFQEIISKISSKPHPA